MTKGGGLHFLFNHGSYDLMLKSNVVDFVKVVIHFESLGFEILVWESHKCILF